MTDTPRTLTLDVAKYQDFLDGENLSTQEKRDFIESLWQIVCEFVMLGFEVHPLQQAQKDGEKTPKNSAFTSVLGADMIECLNADTLPQPSMKGSE